jgi:DHA1 family tetracycline resistance protein-like MFS transporter
MSQIRKTSLAVIFVTVFLDLIGFGIVIPLVSVYGKHYGASPLELAVLGAIYSAAQFLFSPLWGGLSDRVGRRPILLLSLVGSTLSYFGFAFATSIGALIVTRGLAGAFAANISTAQAYMADITETKDRSKAMGLVGAAFGIGFTLGPPLGGIASAKFGLAAPGLIAGTICALNTVVAWVRLGESLPPERRVRALKGWTGPLPLVSLRSAFRHPTLGRLLLVFFLVTLAFSNMEQTFSLLFQSKFNLETRDAGLKTGLVLMWSGVLGAVVQGGLIRKLGPKVGDYPLMRIGMILTAIVMAVFPLLPTYGTYFIGVLPMAFGVGILNPSLYSAISKGAQEHEQGLAMGLTQGVGSLARAVGPFVGLWLFAIDYRFPFWLASLLYGLTFLVVTAIWRSSTRVNPI